MVLKRLAALIFALCMAYAPCLADQTNFSYLHLAGSTTATAVKDGSGILHTLTINTAGASGVITLFDLGKNACTATPSTNVIAVLTLPASGALPGSLLYDARFLNGLCIQDTVAASDQTVSFN
jgi:hypothetical protein